MICCKILFETGPCDLNSLEALHKMFDFLAIRFTLHLSNRTYSSNTDIDFLT